MHERAVPVAKAGCLAMAVGCWLLVITMACIFRQFALGCMNSRNKVYCPFMEWVHAAVSIFRILKESNEIGVVGNMEQWCNSKSGAVKIEQRRCGIEASNVISRNTLVAY
jgi:hypothetical protein